MPVHGSNLKYDVIKIEFHGYSKDYTTKEKITISVTDSTKVRNLNNLKNTLQRKWFANVKGTEFIIRLVYTNSKTGEQLLVSILKSMDSTPTIEYGFGGLFDGVYKNDKFFDYVASIINLKEIKKFKGNLSQEEYGKFE